MAQPTPDVEGNLDATLRNLTVLGKKVKIFSSVSTQNGSKTWFLAKVNNNDSVATIHIPIPFCHVRLDHSRKYGNSKVQLSLPLTFSTAFHEFESNIAYMIEKESCHSSAGGDLFRPSVYRSLSKGTMYIDIEERGKMSNFDPMNVISKFQTYSSDGSVTEGWPDDVHFRMGTPDIGTCRLAIELKRVYTTQKGELAFQYGLDFVEHYKGFDIELDDKPVFTYSTLFETE